MEAEIALAEEYGFNVIDLYGTGFMDCSTKEASNYYLRDGLHPKDSGSIVLGEHIAAEIHFISDEKWKIRRTGFELVHSAHTGVSGAVSFGSGTCEIYGQLTKDTRNDIYVRLVCELLCV